MVEAINAGEGQEGTPMGGAIVQYAAVRVTGVKIVVVFKFAIFPVFISANHTALRAESKVTPVGPEAMVGIVES